LLKTGTPLRLQLSGEGGGADALMDRGGEKLFGFGQSVAYVGRRGLVGARVPEKGLLRRKGRPIERSRGQKKQTRKMTKGTRMILFSETSAMEATDVRD